MNVIRNRLPTPAMLLACVALVVALGGVSYAAAVLPENSVGTPQLKKKSVTRAKLKKDAVTGVKVKNGSLMAADFKAGQFPAGPQARRGRRETLARQDHRVSRGLGIVKKTETNQWRQ